MSERAMLAVCAVAVIYLMSVSHAAPLACEYLLRPLNELDHHHLEGRWAMIAGSLSELPLIEHLRLRDSATAKFSSASETNVSFRRTMSLNNTCSYKSFNISLEGSTFTFDNGRVNTTFIQTSCDDCILLSFDVKSGTRRHFYLYSRRRQLEQREIEEFRVQVECVNMPPPVVMDPTKELCPEEKTAKDARKAEERKY